MQQASHLVGDDGANGPGDHLRADTGVVHLDEQSFRYNNREAFGDHGRFEKMMVNVAGKLLTYEELTGAGAATSH